MQNARTIFNPAAFDPASQGGQEKAEKETKEAKEYPTTGNATRDNVRKVLFETLIQDLGGSAKLPARDVVEQLESEILKQCKDPKSRQYRDMARVIQNKLKGPRFVETRQQLLDGSLGAETVCSEEFLQGKSGAGSKAGPPSANAPRPGRPMGPRGMGMARGPPGQPVRPRGGPPNLGRAGFRPSAPRAPVPVARPMPQQMEQAQEPVQPQAQSMTNSAEEINQASPPIQETEPAQASAPQFIAGGDVQHDPAPRSTDAMQRPDDHAPVTDYFGQQPEQLQQEEQNVGAFSQQQTLPDQGVSGQQEDPASRGAGLQVQATLEEDLKPVPQPVQDPNLSHRTENSQLDISANSAGAPPAKGKKKKKKAKVPKKKEVKEEERLLLQQENLMLIQEEAQTQPNEAQQQEQPKPEEHVEKSEPERFPVGAFDQPVQENQPQILDGLAQVDEVSVAREHSPTNRNSLNAPPPAEMVQPEPQAQVQSEPEEPSKIQGPFAQEQTLAQLQEQEVPQNDQRPQDQQVANLEEPAKESTRVVRPLQLEQQLQESQDGGEAPAPRYPLTSRSGLVRAKPSSAGSQAELIRLQNELQSAKKEAELAMEHNKQLKEDARKARYEKKQSEQALEAYKLTADQQVQLLKAQLNLKEQAQEKLKRDFTDLLDEKEGYKERVMKLTKESQIARENMEEQMRNALQRMASQGGGSAASLLGGSQQPASGVVMTSTQGQGQNSGSMSGASNQQELQKEMQVMRQHYESQLQDHKHQLQMRIKDLQRVERQNISLSEQNKHLSDLTEQLQVQNLSTVAGSGSFQNTQPPGAHHSNPAQLMQSQHMGQSTQQQQHQTSGAYAGIAGNILSSGGQGTVQILESGDADDGGRDGETRYFNDITQDEGTGGVRYNQQNPMEAIPQSSSGISGGQYNSHSGAGGGSSFGAVGHNQSRFAAGGGYDGGYGQLPENGDENSDEENSEPEREHQHEEDDDEEVDDDGYYQNYETVGDWYGQSNLEDQRRRPREQAPGNQTEMDVGGVHNETGDENEESNEDDEDGVGESVALGNGMGQLRQGDNHASNPTGFSDSQPKQRVNNHQSQQLPNMIEDDQEGEVEDGSRGEEGGCRESNYAEEEIEQSLSITGGIGSGLAQDPETEVLPSKGNSQQPSSMLLAQQFSDNGAYPPASAGGVVETGRKTQLQHPYEEEEGGEDIYVHHHHGGNDNEDNEYMVEEEEKGDGASKAFKADGQSASQVLLQGQSQSAGAGFGMGVGGQRHQQPQSSISLGGGAAQSNLQSYRNQSATQNAMMHQQQVSNQSLTQEQQQQMMGMFQEESSNGGASVTCQPQANAVVAAGSARVVPTAPSPMQSTQATGNGGQQRVGPSPLSTSQGRNPRRGHKQQFQQQSTHKSRQGGGAGGNVQTRNQMQSSQQSRSSGRNTRQGPQRTNQQQFLMQAAPSGEQSQPASQQQLLSQAQSQQIMEAPSSQASATGSLVYTQSQQRANFGIGNQQPLGGSQPQQTLQNKDNNEESKVELGQSSANSSANNQNQYIGNAQSSSMASGGSSSTATMMQQMPASHASASASAANLGNQTQNQQYQSAASQQLTNQAAHGAVNQQKGVVHTAGQSSQLQPQSSGTGVPAPRQPANGNMRANNGQQQPQQQQQEIMNAESGSTAFTSQSMQRSYTNQLSQQTSHAQVSSPPSTSQTGGGGSISSTGPHQNSAALAQLDNQEAASAGGICAGDADFYVAAVGAPPSRSGAAGITQANSSGQNAMRQQQTQMTESGQNQAGANNSQPQMSANRQYPGQMHQHPRLGSRGNMAGGYHPSRPHGVQDQQSLHSQSMTFLSGSGEQEEQPPSIQSQFGAGSAASAAGGGSAANENAMYQSASNPYQQMHHIQQMQQQQDTGNSQSHQAQMQLNNSMQLQQMQNQGSESRKTSGANTPSKDGADTPPYRDKKPQNSNYIHNLTTKLLVLQNQEGENSRGRASSANREQNAYQNAAEEQKVGAMPPGMFE